MTDLPTNDHPFYAGIDPGFSGAIGLMNAEGTLVKVWDMPVTGTGGKREYHLTGLRDVFKQLTALPDVAIGIEWPTTRPGEGAERSERFGRGKGYLEAFAFCHKLAYYKIAPNLWKSRLSLPGKSDKDANKLAIQMLDMYYPNATPSLRGPRGGIRDGRCDALLIAHFLRTRGLGGLRSVVERYGTGSPQALAMIFRGGRRGRKSGKPVDIT